MAATAQHTHAHTKKKKSLKNQPVPEERPAEAEAAGEEKSANPAIRSALRHRHEHINFEQASSRCHSTIVSIPSVSEV